LGGYDPAVCFSLRDYRRNAELEAPMTRVFEFFRQFFSSNTLSPHGICLLWRPELIWTHVVSDAVIGVAYFSIPLAMAVFLHRRRDVKFGWVVWMFVAFILLCGVTHFMSIWTLWRPDYGVEALLKMATAFASLATAVALWPLLPAIMAIPSPSTLESRVVERDKAMMDLRAAMETMMEMREHDERQKLLLNELNHRVKNTLTSVQSIAVQTLKSPGDKRTFGDTFVDRLISLSTTHDLLVKHEWRSAYFHELVTKTLGHYGQPYSVAGPDLRLQPNVAVNLGMALHELATNAVKHGAWSTGGAVKVSTAIDGDKVHIVWQETGGRGVAGPVERGFGTRLLERGVARELGATVNLDFGVAGLVCTIRAPLSEKLEPVRETVLVPA
jgi:two-component sensor histidine kinase